MAQNQLNKLVWLVDTINRARFITFEDINRKWIDNKDLNNGDELLKRTFHKWKNSIFDIFGLQIDCEKRGEYRYYIANMDDLHNGSVEKWLLSTCSVSNSLIGCRAIKDRIVLENVPSGLHYLDSVIDAMKRNCVVDIKYYNYMRGDVHEYALMPLCVKLFKQRWYMVGKACDSDFIGIYCLDRMHDLTVTDKSFDYPEDFSPQNYFDGFFGVFHDLDTDVETVVLKASASQANYIRDLPLMQDGAQVETERCEDYSIFEIRVRPTYDFMQELLWHRDEIEVLKPAWLRDEMVEIIDCMRYKYGCAD